MIRNYKINFSKQGNNLVYEDNIKGCNVVAYCNNYVLVESDRRLKGIEIQDIELATILANIETCKKLDYLQVLKNKLLALYRYRFEVKGIELNGLFIPTDRSSQSMINGAYASLKNGLINTIDFKCIDKWETATLETLEPIAKAVAEHVQKCFSAERLVSEYIDSIEDIDILRKLDIQDLFNKQLNQN